MSSASSASSCSTWRRRCRPSRRRPNPVCERSVSVARSSTTPRPSTSRRAPYPELNVVDMLVFVMLARGALEEYWIPTELGARGQPLLDAFTRAEERTRHLSAKILSVEQQEAVRELVADWRRRHPGVFVVEGVRFEQFAYRVGEVAEERARRARGLFGQIRSA